MSSTRILIFVFAVILLLFPAVSPAVSGADGITSRFNGKTLELSAVPRDYSFYFTGHIYGAPETTSAFPAASFLSNIEMINESGAKFLVLNGDIYRDASPLIVANFKKTVCDRIEIPIFNAVGNHDLALYPEVYEANFGKTWYEFKYGTELYIVLDVVADNCTITGEQKEWLQSLLSHAGVAQDIKNVFLFTHYLVWSQNNEAMSKILFPNVNSYLDYENIDDFKSVIMPDIVRLSKTRNVFMVAGDIGVSWSLSLFYHQDPDNNITYIASGIGDTGKDAMVRVDIKQDSGVAFTPVSLTGEGLKAMEHYGLEYWELEKKVGIAEPDNSLVSRASRALSNIYFQVGVAFALALVIIFIGGYIMFKKLGKR